MDKYFYRPELEQALWLDMQSRLPDRLFDCHCHLGPGSGKKDAVGNEQHSDVAFWHKAMGKLAGASRLAGAMIMPRIVNPEQADSLNEFVRSEAARYTGFAVAHLIKPEDDQDKTEQLIRDHPVITSLKPYFRYSPNRWASTFDQFFPEWMARLADRHHLSVMLHIAREREALSDPKNYRLIQSYCEKYPNMRLILAHNALGHNVENLRKGLPHICGYPNIWFDSSGISESGSTNYILEYFGPKRLMYGSDLPLGTLLGKIHSSGNGLMCIFENRIDYTIHFATEEYITTTYEFNTECMLSLLTAADQWGLGKDDLADIFYNNAAWVYRLKDDGSGPDPERCRYEQTRYTQNLNEDSQPEPTTGVFSLLYDAQNTPYTDLASPAARDCPLGFREHATMAAARKELACCLPGKTHSDEYARRLQALHVWSEGVAVTATADDALELVSAATASGTGRQGTVFCVPDDAVSGQGIQGTRCTYGDLPALTAALATRPAALYLVVDGFFTRDDAFLRAAVQAAREHGVNVIYDERHSGFRHPLNSAGRILPDPDALIYGASASNGYAIGVVVAAQPVWQALASQSWRQPSCPAVAAALAVLDTPADAYRRLEVAGKRLVEAWQRASDTTGLPIRISGSTRFPCFRFASGNPEQMRHSYIRAMAQQGVIADLHAYVKSTDIFMTNLEALIVNAFQMIAGQKPGQES